MEKRDSNSSSKGSHNMGAADALCSRGWRCLLLCLLVSSAAGSLHNPSYQRPVTDDELHSPITKSIDKSFSRFADEVQSDKSNRGSSYHYIYSESSLLACKAYCLILIIYCLSCLHAAKVHLQESCSCRPSVLSIAACKWKGRGFILCMSPAGKYLSPVRREPMRLLEIGMGCSMHDGVNGLHTLAVSSPRTGSMCL
jgi:hypothetical protein